MKKDFSVFLLCERNGGKQRLQDENRPENEKRHEQNPEEKVASGPGVPSPRRA